MKIYVNFSIWSHIQCDNLFLQKKKNGVANRSYTGWVFSWSNGSFLKTLAGIRERKRKLEILLSACLASTFHRFLSQLVHLRRSAYFMWICMHWMIHGWTLPVSGRNPFVHSIFPTASQGCVLTDGPLSFWTSKNHSSHLWSVTYLSLHSACSAFPRLKFTNTW